MGDSQGWGCGAILLIAGHSQNEFFTTPEQSGTIAAPGACFMVFSRRASHGATAVNEEPPPEGSGGGSSVPGRGCYPAMRMP